jgi:hypothetical protein
LLAVQAPAPLGSPQAGRRRTCQPWPPRHRRRPRPERPPVGGSHWPRSSAARSAAAPNLTFAPCCHTSAGPITQRTRVSRVEGPQRGQPDRRGSACLGRPFALGRRATTASVAASQWWSRPLAGGTAVGPSWRPRGLVPSRALAKVLDGPSPIRLIQVLLDQAAGPARAGLGRLDQGSGPALVGPTPWTIVRVDQSRVGPRPWTSPLDQADRSGPRSRTDLDQTGSGLVQRWWTNHARRWATSLDALPELVFCPSDAVVWSKGRRCARRRPALVRDRGPSSGWPAGAGPAGWSIRPGPTGRLGPDRGGPVDRPGPGRAGPMDRPGPGRRSTRIRGSESLVHAEEATAQPDAPRNP